MSVDSVVPTFKQSSDPIEEVFQTQDDDIIETDFSCLHSETFRCLFPDKF